MKFLAPPHIRGDIYIGGAHFRIDDDGVLNLPDGNYSGLLPADFVPMKDAPAVAPVSARYDTAPDEHLDN